jgi:hypothetical protein
VPGVDCGLKVGVSGGVGDSVNYDFNVAKDASVAGHISVSQSDISSEVTVIKPKKNDYGLYNAKWFQWAYRMPVDKSSLWNTADGSTEQKGDVWFIGSGFVPPPPDTIISRDITIPAGKKLFVPLFNVGASTIEGNGEGKELVANVDDTMGYVQVRYATVDGNNADYYRAPTGLFKFGPLPDNNALQAIYNDPNGYPEGTRSESAADGYYMMLELSPGDHKINWGSSLVDHPVWGSFVQDVEYTVHVEPTNQGGKK